MFPKANPAMPTCSHCRLRAGSSFRFSSSPSVSTGSYPMDVSNPTNSLSLIFSGANVIAASRRGKFTCDRPTPGCSRNRFSSSQTQATQ